MTTTLQYRLTRDLTVSLTGASSVTANLTEDTILQPDDIDTQTDPDWCTMLVEYDGEWISVQVHNEDIEEIVQWKYCSVTFDRIDASGESQYEPGQGITISANNRFIPMIVLGYTRTAAGTCHWHAVDAATYIAKYTT